MLQAARFPMCCQLIENLRLHQAAYHLGIGASQLLMTVSVVVQIRAVLTGALTMSDGTTLNTATELNAFIYNTIATWCVSCHAKLC